MAQAALRRASTASANVRATAPGCGTSARAPRRSRDPRPCRSRNERRTVAPGASRIRWRRLTIGSSTTPVVPTARGRRARPDWRGCGPGRGSARDRSPIRPAPAAGPRGSATWKAHAAGIASHRAGAGGRAARRSRAGIRSRRRACRTPDARGRPPRTRGRSRHSWSRRSRGSASRGCGPSAAALRRRLRSRPRCRAASTISSSRRRNVARSGENVDAGSRRARGASADRSADQTVAAAHVAQVDELAVRVARRVAPPPRHREAAPEAARRRRRW